VWAIPGREGLFVDVRELSAARELFLGSGKRHLTVKPHNKWRDFVYNGINVVHGYASQDSQLTDYGIIAGLTTRF
jgi:hypothetical protein